MLDHERMPVYQAALRFAAQADEIAQHFPATRRYLRLQLRRAAASIGQNIGEGAGEHSPPEKARFYRMALRSATECAATLDLALLLHAAESTAILPAKQAIEEIVSMLVGLCKYLETKGGSGKGRDKGRDKGKGEGKGPRR